MRFAFLTPEFPTTSTSAGGLATFLGRLTIALVESGHIVDVFTIGGVPSRERWNGVHVISVPSQCPKGTFWNLTAGHVSGRLSSADFQGILARAQMLADALEEEAAIAEYDVVHGADYGLTTHFVRRCQKRVVVVRISSCNAICRKWWGSAFRLDHVLLTRAEHKIIREADLVYAPSKRAANHYREATGVEVRVIRPPFNSEPVQPVVFDQKLPSRFLLHFGNIDKVKGSDTLANALTLAWQAEPVLEMVWAGSDRAGLLDKFRASWGEKTKQVQWLGAVERVAIPALIKRAVAVVAPSRIDNLPNNVLEAQALHVPVIGTRNSSIDEIVVDSKSGSLIEPGNFESLAHELVSAWRGDPPFNSACATPPIFDELRPDLALQNLFAAIKQTSSKKLKSHVG